MLRSIFFLLLCLPALLAHKCGNDYVHIEEPSASSLERAKQHYHLHNSKGSTLTRHHTTGEVAPAVIGVVYHLMVNKSNLFRPEHEIRESLFEQTRVLNERYQRFGFRFYQQSYQLVESKFTDDCCQPPCQKFLDAIRPLAVDADRHINVYIDGSLSTSETGCGNLGFAGVASPPGAGSTGPNSWKYGWSFQLAESLPGGTYLASNTGLTLVHELGHYFGLAHPFQGGCSYPNDGVYDTPAESNQHTDVFCADANHPNVLPWIDDSCPDMPGNDPIHNIMDYSADNCKLLGQDFTPGQIVRALAMTFSFREKLMECVPLTCAAGHFFCGEHEDGCGGYIFCGSCPEEGTQCGVVTATKGLCTRCPGGSEPGEDCSVCLPGFTGPDCMQCEESYTAFPDCDICKNAQIFDFGANIGGDFFAVACGCQDDPTQPFFCPVVDTFCNKNMSAPIESLHFRCAVWEVCAAPKYGEDFLNELRRLHGLCFSDTPYCENPNAALCTASMQAAGNNCVPGECIAVGCEASTKNCICGPDDTCQEGLSCVAGSCIDVTYESSICDGQCGHTGLSFEDGMGGVCSCARECVESATCCPGFFSACEICENNADCPGDQTCDDGLCVPTTPGDCPDETFFSPNTLQCIPRKTSGEYCNAVQLCASGLQCEDHVCAQACGPYGAEEVLNFFQLLSDEDKATVQQSLCL